MRAEITHMKFSQQCLAHNRCSGTVTGHRVNAIVIIYSRGSSGHSTYISLWSWVHPASVSVWKPGRHRSHLSPVTPGLQLHRPELSHRGLREPVTHKVGERKEEEIGNLYTDREHSGDNKYYAIDTICSLTQFPHRLSLHLPTQGEF